MAMMRCLFLSLRAMFSGWGPVGLSQYVIYAFQPFPLCIAVSREAESW